MASEVKLIHGDCLEYMKYMSDKSVDMILTDPPYGIDFCSFWTSRKERLENDKLDDWEMLVKSFLPEFKRIITDVGCCCCCCGGGKTAVTALFTIEAIRHFKLIQTLVWKKFIGLGWKYRPSYENIVILSKDEKNYAFYDETKKCSNVIEGINQYIPQYRGNEGGHHDEHPTQKPVVLMERLIKIHSKEGQTVFDPFMGSGTTGVACLKLNRNFIGCEIKKEYYDIAEMRLENHKKQLTLF